MTSSYSSLLAETRKVLRQASDLFIKLHNSPRTITHKGRIDLVTETDLALEAFLQDALAPLVPGAQFVAEESATSLTLPDTCWIIDPVDGTTNYAHGLPVVGISVAYYQGGEAVVGIVEVPLLGETWWACKGGGAFVNDKQVHVSSTDTLERALLATGFPYDYDGRLENILTWLREFLPKTQGVRRCGAASVDLAWVAGGRFDGYYEVGLKPWDAAAGVCILQEAGGTVTHFDGSPFTYCSQGRHDVLATNGLLHNAMMQVLEKAPGWR